MAKSEDKLSCVFERKIHFVVALYISILYIFSYLTLLEYEPSSDEKSDARCIRDAGFLSLTATYLYGAQIVLDVLAIFVLYAHVLGTQFLHPIERILVCISMSNDVFIGIYSRFFMSIFMRLNPLVPTLIAGSIVTPFIFILYKDAKRFTLLVGPLEFDVATCFLMCSTEIVFFFAFVYFSIQWHWCLFMSVCISCAVSLLTNTRKQHGVGSRHLDMCTISHAGYLLVHNMSAFYISKCFVDNCITVSDIFGVLSTNLFFFAYICTYSRWQVSLAMPSYNAVTP